MGYDDSKKCFHSGTVALNPSNSATAVECDLLNSMKVGYITALRNTELIPRLMRNKNA
jgi:hypothetical protein